MQLFCVDALHRVRSIELLLANLNLMSRLNKVSNFLGNDGFERSGTRREEGDS
jgi:hypothetical protein